MHTVIVVVVRVNAKLGDCFHLNKYHMVLFFEIRVHHTSMDWDYMGIVIVIVVVVITSCV